MRGRGGGGVAGGQAEGHRAQRGGLRQRGQVGVGLAAQGVPDGQRDAVLEADLVAYGVDEVVHPGAAVGVGAGQAGQAQLRAFDRDGRVRPRHLDDRLGGALGEPVSALATTCGSRSSLPITPPPAP